MAPANWPDAVDLAIALVFDPSPTAEAASSLDLGHEVPHLTFSLPLLRPLEQYIPPELERYRKYLQPEPFRGLTVLAAVHELEAVAGRREPGGGSEKNSDDGSVDGPLPELQSFVDITVAFLLRESLQGCVELGPRSSIKQRGLELVRRSFRWPVAASSPSTPPW